MSMIHTVTKEELIKQGKDVGIDPHFSDNKKYHSPIARFEPTDRGWEMALTLCINLEAN